MLQERADNPENSYKCSRCGAMFGSHNENIVRCPFCYQVCEEVKCRVIEMSNEEY